MDFGPILWLGLYGPFGALTPGLWENIKREFIK